MNEELYMPRFASLSPAGSSLICGTLLGVSSSVFAQDAPVAAGAAPTTDTQLEEITVTAERRETYLQKTSESVATLTGAEIDRAGLTSLDEVARNMPNVLVSSSAIGFSATIRGVGTSPIPADIGGSSGVSSLYDGLYSLQEQAARVGFYDVARFEVLRGPQGTLYGRNAEGGVFNVITNNPTQELERSLTVEYGNYDSKRVVGVVNLPISDTLAVRIAATHVDREGYLSNGQDDEDATAARVKVLYTPTDRIEALLAGDYTYTGGQGMGTVSSYTYPLRDPWTSPNPTDQRIRNHSYRLWSNLKFDLGIADLTLIPAYQGSGPESHFQYTGAYDNIGSNPLDLVQRSLEVRLASKPGTPVAWVVGTYSYNYNQVAAGQDSTLSNGVIIPDPTQPFKTTTQTSDSVAAFAQATVSVATGLRLIGGVRESRDRYSIQTVIPTPEGPAYFYPLTRGEWKHFDWKTGVEYDVAPESMLYATVATGYRPGGFDPLPTGGFNLESLRSYEIGSKNELFERHLRINGDVFYYDYSNFQVVTFVPGGPLGAEPEVQNAAKANIYGAEGDLVWVATGADSLSLSAGYLRSRINSPVSVSDPDGNSPTALISIYGQTFMNSPEWTDYGSYKHVFALANGAEISTEPVLHYTSSYHITPAVGRTSDQGGYAELDTQLSFKSPHNHWGVTLFGRNLTDRAVKSAYLPPGNLLLQVPRTYGITANMTF